MKIYETKTKVMIFNQATSVAVHPTVKIDQDNIIEVVEQIKLLGIILRSDMKRSIEHGIALKKIPNPKAESDLRIIILSVFWSQCMQS